MNHLTFTRASKVATALAATLVIVAATLFASAAHAGNGWRIDLEGSAAWQARNDFAVPGNTGTRVDLPRADDSPTFTGRATVAWQVANNWWVRGLYAPLRTVTTLVPAATVDFQDASFAAGNPLEVEYIFNSYRLSVYRRFASGPLGELRLGLTAKVRDAKIAVTSGTLSREETDLGFVPLIYAGATFSPWPTFSVDLDLDALGAPQGYAVDGSVRVLQSLGGGLRLFVGYRVLDGGADVDQVYSFGTFHYATGGITFGR